METLKCQLCVVAPFSSSCVFLPFGFHVPVSRALFSSCRPALLGAGSGSSQTQPLQAELPLQHLDASRASTVFWARIWICLWQNHLDQTFSPRLFGDRPKGALAEAPGALGHPGWGVGLLERLAAGAGANLNMFLSACPLLPS